MAFDFSIITHNKKFWALQDRLPEHNRFILKDAELILLMHEIFARL